MLADTPVLEVKDLSVAYETRQGSVQAVSDVNLSVFRNEIVGLIGESGSGKSTLAYAIMRLLRGGAGVTSGTIRVLEEDVYALSPETLRQFRWNKMSMVFQSAMSALNPVLTIEQQMVDTLRSHRSQLSPAQARQRAAELLQLVHIRPDRMRSFPHELSGGMRQRVVIAIAIALNPALVVMDEPTTALDVVVQRSILDEIQALQRIVGFSILFISHDFSLVAELCSRVAVMYAGRVVELATTQGLFSSSAHHPYTEGLRKAVPRVTAADVSIEGIPGTPPDPARLPAGCAFHPRCAYKMAECTTTRPSLRTVENATIACHLFADKSIAQEPRHV